MVYRYVMKGLSFFEKRWNNVINLFQFSIRKSKTRTGFASDQFVFFLCKRCFVKTFFKSAFTARITAVTDIRRFGKFWTDIFFIRNTGRSTFSACPARAVRITGATFADFLNGALVKESGFAVIKCFTVGTGFIKKMWDLFLLKWWCSLCLIVLQWI